MKTFKQYMKEGIGPEPRSEIDKQEITWRDIGNAFKRKKVSKAPAQQKTKQEPSPHPPEVTWRDVFNGFKRKKPK